MLNPWCSASRSQLHVVDPEEIPPIRSQPNVAASLAASPHFGTMGSELFIRSPQIAECIFERFRRRKLDPGPEYCLAVEVQGVSRRTALREADDDLAGFGNLLHRHLPEIGQRILTLAEAACGASVFQGEMVRSHPTVAFPADEAVHESIRPLLLQHDRRLYKAGLWTGE
jgi:hypothetical protein